jgi:hypothetical protein
MLNMIAVSTGDAWLLTGFAELTLRATWVMLNGMFTLIDRAWAKRRATELSHQRQEARVRGDGSDF